MPGKKARGVAAPGTPPAVRERYEAMKRDPEARKYAEEKGRHGVKGTLAAIAWAAQKKKRGKKGKKKMKKSVDNIPWVPFAEMAKSAEVPTEKEREKVERAETGGVEKVAIRDVIRKARRMRAKRKNGAVKKAVVTEKLYKDSKFVKRTVDDEAVMACLRQKIRSRHRSNKQYNPEKANAKCIYEDVLADSLYDQYIEAAINLMKKKIPFSVAYVGRIIKEVDMSSATKESPSSVPEALPGY
jgi:hypothetical protein